MAKKVTIVRASNAFIYLPLYLAESYDLFSVAQVGDRPPARLVTSPDFTFVTKRATVEGDRNAIDEMIDLTERGQLAFALGDPLEIIEAKAEPSELVVLGTIVKRPPFWVVDGHEAKTIDDLIIDNIIFYDRDALQTGHYLGRFIADRKRLRAASRFPVIKEVGRELDLLIKKKQAGLPNCGAVTADILGIARAVHRTGFEQCKPILPIFEQKEFQNFVSSAFITHRRVLKDGMQVATILLDALKRAMGMVHDLPVVARLCREQSKKGYFREQLKLTTEEKQIKQLSATESIWVARRIIEDKLFLTDFTISVADWDRAAKSDRWTGGRPDEVVALYKEVVEPGNALIFAEPKERYVPGGERVCAPTPKSTDDVVAGSKFEFLKELKHFDVGETIVVGNYRRFDEQTRNTLTNRVREIKRGLLKNTEIHENFLIWAAPGSGKTFFFEQIAKSMGETIDSVTINFANITREELQTKLSEIEASDKPALVLLDEVDARPEETWLYVETLPSLDTNLSEKRQAVFVLVGSMKGGIDAMVESMRARSKGSDLLNRVPSWNHFTIPDLTVGDQVAIVANQLAMASQSSGQTIAEIEKTALYYILAQDEYKSARRLSDFIGSAALRIGALDDKLTFDNLFNRGDILSKRFWANHQNIMETLSNTYVRLGPRAAGL